MNIFETFDKLDKLNESKSLKEGCWKVPYTTEETQDLLNLFKNKIPLNRVGDTLDGDDPKQHIDLHIGDDILFDELSVERDLNPDGDARPTIRAWLRNAVVGHWDEFTPYDRENDPKTKTPFTEEAMNNIMTIVDGKKFVPPAKGINMFNEAIDYKKFPLAPENELTKEAEKIIAKNDLGIITSQISPTKKDGDEGVYIFEVHGGKNGSGDTIDYLNNIKNCIKDLRKVFKHATYLLDYDFDALDDLFYAHIGCMPRELNNEEHLILEERLVPKTGNKKLNEDLIVYKGESGIEDCENIVKAYNDTKDINTKKCLKKALSTAMFQTYSTFGDKETPKLKEWREKRWKELVGIAEQWARELYPVEFAKEPKKEEEWKKAKEEGKIETTVTDIETGKVVELKPESK